MKTLAILLLFGVCWRTAYQQCVSPQENAMPKKLSLYEGQREFSLKLLQAINQMTPKDNVFFSPFSTYHALLLAYMIAGGETKESLQRALLINEKANGLDIERAYKLDKLIKRKYPPTSYEFNNANKIYVSKEIEIRQCMTDLFLEELEPTDFKSNPEGTRNRINNWVEEKTKHMIKDLLPPGSVGPDTNLILLNAAYFKGLWASKFNPQSTNRTLFYSTPEEVKFVQMMTQKGTFNFHASEALKAHVLELPYKGGNASMFILLPPFNTPIDEVLNQLKNPDIFINIINGAVMEEREVIVSLPKFTMETSIELLPVLQSIGAGDVFSDKANFTWLSENGNVSLGNALHKARIEVSEEGTKAAASTVLFTFRSSRPLDPAEFICNHPFIYLIYDHTQQIILFNGVYRKPS